MTLRCSRNNGPFTQMAEAFYTMKEFWKATGGTKHYTVEASGDGIGGSYSYVSDIITSFLGAHGATVAGGLNNPSSWFVLEEPDGTRQWVFQRHTTTYDYRWYIKYSRAGLYVRHGTAAPGDTIIANGVIDCTMTLAAAPFSADMAVGHKIEVSGSAHGGNNGVFTITGRTGGTVTYSCTTGADDLAYAGDWGVCAATTDEDTRPTAADEENFMDNTPDTSLSYPPTGSFYMQTVVEGDTPQDDAYPGWMLMRYVTSGNPWGLLMFNCATAASALVADSDKMVFCALEADALNWNSGGYLGYTTTNSHQYCYQRYGEADEDFNKVGALMYYHDSTQQHLPDNAAANPEDAKYPLLPVFLVVDHIGAVHGMKGQSHMWRWNPASALTYGDVVYDGTEYWLVSNDVVLRGWPDSTGPTV